MTSLVSVCESIAGCGSACSNVTSACGRLGGRGRARRRGCRSRRVRAGPQASRPGRRTWPGLRRKKVTVSLAFTATPRSCPLAPSIPDGRSTETTCRPLALMRRITSAIGPVTSRSQTCPQECVDDDCRRADLDRRRSLDRLRPHRRGEARIAAQRRALALKGDPNGIAPLLQESRRDEAVATIVAGAARRAPASREADGRPCRRRPGRRAASARSRACRPRSSGGRREPSRRGAGARACAAIMSRLPNRQA